MEFAFRNKDPQLLNHDEGVRNAGFRQDEDEFFAPVATQDVAFANLCFELPCNGRQDLVRSEEHTSEIQSRSDLA